MPSRSAVLARTDSPLDCPARWVRRRGAKRSKSPKAYVACGISGQMQHMVGCNRAGTMFAINKDKNAPVFKQCDYGLVGDLKDVLPKLVAAL